MRFGQIREESKPSEWSEFILKLNQSAHKLTAQKRSIAIYYYLNPLLFNS